MDKQIKILLFLCVLQITIGLCNTYAQKFVTYDGYARFFSDAPLEQIEAKTYKVQCAMDLQSGEIAFKIPMTTFTFRKPLMQKHFNEKYIESITYPYAIFQGKIINLNSKTLKKGEIQNVEIKGEMTLHGVTQFIKEKGTLQMEGEQIKGRSVFFIKMADYKIKIPRIVFYNIAEEVEVTIEITLKEKK